MPDDLDLIAALEKNVARCIVGKADVVRLAVVGLLARGHLLIEDVPGVGKTTLAAALARSIGGRFARIQFTADMLPSDVIGVSVWDAARGEFSVQGRARLRQRRAGGRDQPHRAQDAVEPARGDERGPGLARPHHVHAAVAVHGARHAESARVRRHLPLPESQLDRFLLRVRIGYPDPADEKAILRGAAAAPDTLAPALALDDVRRLQALADTVHVADLVIDYVMALVSATRESEHLALGVSPRGARALAGRRARLRARRPARLRGAGRREGARRAGARASRDPAGRPRRRRRRGIDRARDRAGRRRPALTLMPGRLRSFWARAWLRWQPRRTIRPTREGWWCLAVTLGLGLTAMNTGNNLLYLLESMILALIIVSGVLSEQSLRGLRVVTVVPDAIHAGAPCTVGARVLNTKRRRPSFSIGLDRPGTGERLAYAARLGPSEERLLTWEETLPRRGRHRLTGVRLTTRFPFGLFLKASRATGADEVIVFPRRVPAPTALLRQASGAGDAPAGRRGRGADVHDLRGYRSGDDPRLIHWRVTARTGTLTVREMEAESAQDAYLVLRGGSAADAERVETALAEAAAVASVLLARGARVGMIGPGIDVPLGQGGAHARRILTALALYEGGSAPSAAGPAAAHGRSSWTSADDAARSRVPSLGLRGRRARRPRAGRGAPARSRRARRVPRRAGRDVVAARRAGAARLADAHARQDHGHLARRDRGGGPCLVRGVAPRHVRPPRVHPPARPSRHVAGDP